MIYALYIRIQTVFVTTETSALITPDFETDLLLPIHDQMISFFLAKQAPCKSLRRDQVENTFKQAN